jgi:hypothetical protein
MAAQQYLLLVTVPARPDHANAGPQALQESVSSVFSKRFTINAAVTLEQGVSWLTCHM